MVTRIAHLADSHLGYRKGNRVNPDTGRNVRSEDFTQAFQFAIQDVIREHQSDPIDLFVHAGDIFDRPRPDWADLAIVAEAITHLKDAGIPQVWIAGNHDMSRIPTPDTPLTMLARIFQSPTIRMAVRADQVILQTEKVYAFGVGWGGWGSGLVNAFPEVGQTSVLIAHGDVDQSGILTQGRDEQVRLPDGFDYYALGHLHIPHQPSLRSSYPGSLERCGWRDLANTSPHWDLVSIWPGEMAATIACPVPARAMRDLGELDYAGDWHSALADRVAGVPPSALCRVLVRNAPRSIWGAFRADLEERIGPKVWHIQVDYAEDGNLKRTHLATWGEPSRLDLDSLFRDYCADLEDKAFAERFQNRGEMALALSREMTDDLHD